MLLILSYFFNSPSLIPQHPPHWLSKNHPCQVCLIPRHCLDWQTSLPLVWSTNTPLVEGISSKTNADVIEEAAVTAAADKADLFLTSTDSSWQFLKAFRVFDPNQLRTVSTRVTRLFQYTAIPVYNFDHCWYGHALELFHNSFIFFTPVGSRGSRDGGFSDLFSTSPSFFTPLVWRWLEGTG